MWVWTQFQDLLKLTLGGAGRHWLSAALICELGYSSFWSSFWRWNRSGLSRCVLVGCSATDRRQRLRSIHIEFHHNIAYIQRNPTLLHINPSISCRWESSTQEKRIFGFFVIGQDHKICRNEAITNFHRNIFEDTFGTLLERSTDGVLDITNEKKCLIVQVFGFEREDVFLPSKSEL